MQLQLARYHPSGAESTLASTQSPSPNGCHTKLLLAEFGAVVHQDRDAVRSATLVLAQDISTSEWSATGGVGLGVDPMTERSRVPIPSIRMTADLDTSLARDRGVRHTRGRDTCCGGKVATCEPLHYWMNSRWPSHLDSRAGCRSVR